MCRTAEEIAADAAKRIATAKAMGANMPESVAVRAAMLESGDLKAPVIDTPLVRLLRQEAAKE